VSASLGAAKLTITKQTLRRCCAATYKYSLMARWLCPAVLCQALSIYLLLPVSSPARQALPCATFCHTSTPLPTLAFLFNFWKTTMHARYYITALTAICSTFAAPLYSRAPNIRYVILDKSNQEPQGLEPSWIAMFKKDVDDALKIVDVTLLALNDPKFQQSDLYKAFINRE
jgi:hypothetical protein